MRRALLLATALTAPLLGQETPDFAGEVLPLLSRRCYACHGPDEGSRKAGLRLDVREEALRALLPGESGHSLLLERVSDSDEDARMPPAEAGARLTAEEVLLLERWIRAEAPYAKHWAFVAPARPALPEVEQADWVRGDLDAFVLSRLEAAGLGPSPEAQRATLARRISLDLVGLPPDGERLAEFLEDTRPDAYERYVDELLASPAFGERWASIWLDVARYADSAGYGSDPLRTIWRYRDWVIDAFNSGQPFDEFTRDQLAGDLLPGATTDQRLATAFHRNTKTNTEGGTDDEEFRIEAVKDRTDTTMQAWMGLTFGCAKCHTHKYDPISIDEYYSLFAFFNQTADSDKGDERPRLRTPSAGQAASLARLEAERADLQGQLSVPLEEAEVQAWSKSARELEASWAALVPVAAGADQGTLLEVEADGTVVAGGPAPETETYTIDLELGPGSWTGLALEALPDPSLPGSGPGRSPGNGNFVVSHLTLHRPPSPEHPDPVARILRLELPGQGRILSLAEVQVFSGGEVVSGAGTARQSSTGYAGPAEYAIDGNTSGVYTDKSVTHTDTEANPWWEVDLGADFPVERISLWNRTDGAVGRRLDGVVVKLLDAERSTIWRARVRRVGDVETPIVLADWEAEIELAAAGASFEQDGWGVGHALDSDQTGSGWAIGPRQGQRHLAGFALSEPLDLEAPALLRLRLTQGFGTAHTLGRLRLHVTGHAGKIGILPADVSLALGALPECTDEQHARLAEYALTVDPGRASLREEAQRITRSIEDLAVVTTPVMEELPPERWRTTRVLSRGNFLQPAHEVEAGVPGALHSWPEDAPLNRLGLASWITDPANPLTARVAVNRWWQALFGRGLVETQENFGRQGLAPSHPGLLDYLAVEYVESGWDTKGLLRQIVTSATYRQSSDSSPSSRGADPHGHLLSRMPRVPLEAEQVRDQALAVSGLLTSKLYGPSVYPPQPPGIWQAAFNGQRSWSTSTGADRYRRGLYVYWRRTAPYPSMETFDAPSRETCTLRRLRTNTPLQALVTLNDPVYVECAQALGRRLLDMEPGEGVAHGVELCLGREATTLERDRLLALYVDALTELSKLPEADALALATDPLGPLPEGADPRRAAAWSAVAGVLLNLDEFLTRQ